MNANRSIATRPQDRSLRKNTLSDLRVPGLLAKYPMIGILMFIIGSLIFGGLTYNLLANGPLLGLDRSLANTLPTIGSRSPAWLKYIIVSGFHIGKTLVVVIDLLLILYFYLKKYWQELAMVVIGGTGSALLWYSLSILFDRERPSNQLWTVVDFPGYPSGHLIASVLCYGFLAYLLYPKIPSAFWKAVMVLGALLIVSFVGFTRVFTAGHYLTDVLAGFAIGIAWFGAAYTLIELYARYRRSKRVQKE